MPYIKKRKDYYITWVSQVTTNIVIDFFFDMINRSYTLRPYINL